MGWMAHRKWIEIRQQPSMLPGPPVPGSCLASFHFLWAIHPIRPVQSTWQVTLLVNLLGNSILHFVFIALPVIRRPLKSIILLLIGLFYLFICIWYIAFCFGNIVQGSAHHAIWRRLDSSFLCSLISFSFPVHPVYLLRCSHTGWFRIIELCVGTTIILNHPVRTM